ncbi:hypothetical protein LWI29_029330 [Acer saccharum]|uniref:Uncharacterized protein n=1 Tax=Acer saccharum TaxID=4024 RepID=A0AA39RNQ9_ACESA|nr:hypothetical protein LWI29_029330 [Acer saccharum]
MPLSIRDGPPNQVCRKTFFDRGGLLKRAAANRAFPIRGGPMNRANMRQRRICLTMLRQRVEAAERGSGRDGWRREAAILDGGGADLK